MIIFLRENDGIMCTGASELPKNVCTQGTGANVSARVQGLDLVLGHCFRARILAWVLEKEFVHISAHLVPNSGTVPGYQL